MVQTPPFEQSMVVVPPERQVRRNLAPTRRFGVRTRTCACETVTLSMIFERWPGDGCLLQSSIALTVRWL
jgi:hypothetical protein